MALRNGIAAFCCLLTIAVDGRAQPYFLPLGDLPGGDIHSRALAVSANGAVVVGEGTNSSGQLEAFRWTQSEGLVGLGHLPDWGVGSTAHGVSADGSVIVGTANDGPGWDKAFRWTAAEGLTALVDAGTGDEVLGNAYDVSADGSVIVGDSLGGPFLWTSDDGLVWLGDLPGGHSGGRAHAVSADGTVVTGISSSQSSDGGEAFRWENGVMTGLGDLPGGDFWSNAKDVSENGSVFVGGAHSDAHHREAFRWTEGEGMVALGTLLGTSFAQAASADGSVVVGWSVAPSWETEGFIWDADHGMRNVSHVLSSLGLDLTGWRLGDATGVSADGNTIVGRAYGPDGFPEAYVAHIPEPGMLVLLAFGGLFVTRRRR